MKLIRAVLIMLFCLQPAISAAVTVTDQAGRPVTVPHSPDRIICLGPGALRLIVYLGAQDRVVGIETIEKTNPKGRPYRIAHPGLATLPACGPGGAAAINKKPDMEAVLSIEPEVIFVTYMDASQADIVQATLGIPVVVLSYGESPLFDEAVFDALLIAGKILGREKRSNEIIAYIRDIKTDLSERTKKLPESARPKAYAGGIGYRGSHGIESTQQDYIPLQWAGALNRAESVQSRLGSHVFVDKETLLGLNPEVIFIDGGGLSLVATDYRKKTAYYRALSAFSSNQVYVLLPFNYYAANIGTALANAYAVGKILYPHSFADIDPEATADEIFTFLVGKPVYSNMKKDFGAIGRPAGWMQ